MPRKARIDAPGALHHLIVRGIERKPIFRDDVDRDVFVERLGLVFTEAFTDCLAWAILPNHVHLLVRSGLVPISTVMQRILTSYALRYNRRHRRHGHLFQNRYKSILCQEEPYLLELVRYIHLNPLRANVVPDYERLKSYPYCGHCVLLGTCAGDTNDWQNTDDVLSLFAGRVQQARRRYGEFVQKGIQQGRKPELVGGGLIRSSGGWSAAKSPSTTGERIKGDERILGETGFVEQILRISQENLDRRYLHQSMGHDFDWLIARVAEHFHMEPGEVTRAGRYPETVKARSLLCYWAAREMGFSTLELSKRLGVSQPTASQSVKRGEKLAAGQKILPEASMNRAHISGISGVSGVSGVST